MLKSRVIVSTILFGLIPAGFLACSEVHSLSAAPGDVAPANAVAATSAQANDPKVIARIREEGLDHSQVMKTLSYLSDVIGPRLTGSPNLKRANEWTRDQLAAWGLENAAVEPWGEFGRGWSLKRFSAEVVEPQAIPLIAFPKAWSPGLDQPIEADVVYLNPQSTAELESFAGKLEGKIVLIGASRTLRAQFTAPGTRFTDEALATMARGRAGGREPTTAPTSGPAELLQAALGRRGGRGGRGAPTTNANPLAQGNIQTQIFNFAVREKAAFIFTPSTIGDGGTMFVQSAAVPTAGRGRGPSIYSTEAPATAPQATISAEHFNRLVRMIEAGEKVRMAVNLQVQFQTQDPQAYNTVAEIPGTDLKDQLVMLGGHLDSWHSGTGATDNGAGVAAAMEAVRIIKALNLKPRRTIRIALWTGEEEGLLGSAGYVREHFGAAQAGRGRGGGGRGNAPISPAQVDKKPEYDKFSVYFNLDNGTGKIRGVYAQSNPNVTSLFQDWLTPFNDLGATTVTPNNTTGTDHLSFDAIGLPAFQFIQDQIEYNSRTHHSNMDVFDRIQEDDLKQAATIMAAFVYDAAMMDEKMPKKVAD